MSIRELKDNYQSFKKNPEKVLPYIVVGMICGISGSFFGGFFSEKGRQLAEVTSNPKSVKMDMPVDNGMKYTPINLENKVGGKFVGAYMSRDAVTYRTSQDGDTSNLQVTPRAKGANQ